MAGKQLKIRCKRCGGTVLIRGDLIGRIGAEPQAAAPRPLEENRRNRVNRLLDVSSSSDDEYEWHVSLDGDTRGPFSTAELGAWLIETPGSWDAHVWREGFPDWIDVHVCPELTPALRLLQPVHAREQEGARSTAWKKLAELDWDSDSAAGVEGVLKQLTAQSQPPPLRQSASADPTGKGEPSIAPETAAARVTGRGSGSTGKSVFVSYRREDTKHVTGRLVDRLVNELGAMAVFWDVDSIPMGVDFPAHIRSQVEQCSVLIAVVGPRWLNWTKKSNGERSLDDPEDFVRLEIEAALQRGVHVIPVYVDGAEPPAASALPPSLRAFALRNGLRLEHDPYFSAGVRRIVSAIRNIFDRAS